MRVDKAIKKRFSCRSYRCQKVPKKLLLELLTLANQAPSAGNQQNRQFVIIRNKKDRQYLAEMNNQRHLEEAPVTILVTTRLDKETIGDYLKSLAKWEMTVSGKKPSEFRVTSKFRQEFKEMKYKWMISDAAAAVENLLLAATEEGLSTCWIGIMDFKGVIKRFGLPADVIPVCLVTMGYQKEPPKDRKERKAIGKLVHWDKY